MWTIILEAAFALFKELCPQSTKEEVVERLHTLRVIDRLRLRKELRTTHGLKGLQLSKAIDLVEEEIANANSDDSNMRAAYLLSAEAFADELIAQRSTP